MVAMQYNSLGTIVIFRNIAPLFTMAIETMFRIPMQASVWPTCGGVELLRIDSFS
jgi:hypothetical protein